jgi:hypothetical protein
MWLFTKLEVNLDLGAFINHALKLDLFSFTINVVNELGSVGIQEACCKILSVYSNKT